MRKKEFNAVIEQVADHAGLRHVPNRIRAGKTWVGICSGISIVMNLDKIRLCVDFSSPDQQKPFDSGGDQEISTARELESSDSESDAPAAFQRTEGKGVSESWFEQYESGVWGFQLRIDQKRRRLLQSGALVDLLESIAKDLNDLGAEDSQPCCQCGAEASTLGYFESMIQGAEIAAYCDTCWKDLQEETRGTIKVAHPTELQRGWAFLFAVSSLFAILWGCLQHPKLGIPVEFLLLGSGLSGVAISVGTAWFANGSNLMLRLGVAINVILATLAGNMIGIKLLYGQAIAWRTLVPFYILQYFPANLGQEFLFLVFGLVGVAVGFLVLRESERVRVS